MNATALMTLAQVRVVGAALADGPAAVVSVFAGRIADAGVDPVPVMRDAKQLLAQYPNLELLWASPREALNVVQADAVGCDIITLTSGLLDKLSSLGRSLDEFSLATVKMFYDDAVAVSIRVLRHTREAQILRICSSRCSLTSICCKNARSTATQIVFENG